MSKHCKTIRSEYPYYAFNNGHGLCIECSIVGIFTSYCFTVFGHYVLLQSNLFQYFLLQHYTLSLLLSYTCSMKCFPIMGHKVLICLLFKEYNL